MKANVRISFNAPVVLTFVAACFVATLLGVISGGSITTAVFSSYRTSLLDPLMYLRLLTHAFGHAGWEHFVGNMTLVLLLGPLLEEKYGSRDLAIVMVFSALAGGIAHNLFFPGLAVCGASGIVFTFILLSSVTQLREGEIPLTFILVAVFFIGQQVFQGLFVQNNISEFGHIVGGVVGAVAGFVLFRKEARGV